jgi:hypothetical protein
MADWLRFTKDGRDIARRGHRRTLQKLAALTQREGRPEMPTWLPSRFEFALATVLLAVFSAALELVEVLVGNSHPFLK